VTDRLPDDFAFDDFLDALGALDAPDDDALPTDADGCVELLTVRTTELASVLARLREASIDPHIELPDRDLDRGDGYASVFVPRGELGRARRVIGIAT
jgi:hypothetical protein